MIGDLQSKIISEGADAQKVYDEFSEFCEDRSRELGFEIKTGKAEVKELNAAIADEAAKALAEKEEAEKAAKLAQENAVKEAAAALKKEAFEKPILTESLVFKLPEEAANGTFAVIGQVYITAR